MSYTSIMLDRLLVEEMINDSLREEIKTLESKLSQSVEREKLLRECVEFYAEEKSWYNYKGVQYRVIASSDCNNGAYKHGGKRARQCLKQITEQGKSNE